MQNKSHWKKYQPKQIRRYFKTWWHLRSQKRYSEAIRVLMIYRYPPFWIPVIGLIVLWAFWGSQSCSIDSVTQSNKPDIESVTQSKIDWASVRQAAHSRVSNINFHLAKKKLYPVYLELGMMKTFYCGCDFTLTPKKHDRESCGLVLSKYVKAQGIDAEHIVPESFMGGNRPCWQNGGRKACKNDFEHQLAAGDLHNLVPSIPSVNRLRSNYMPVDNLPGEASEFGSCDVEIERPYFEPPPNRRGDIARTYLYMWRVYDAPLTDDHVDLFERWHREDPPDKNEIAIAKAKAQVQGNVNPLLNP